jgi:hypothetical protein
MIKLSTVLRGLSNDIRAYALSQPLEPVHTSFQDLAEIFHAKAAEVEQLEQASPLGDVGPLQHHNKTVAAKELDVGPQGWARKRLKALMASNIAAGIVEQASRLAWSNKTTSVYVVDLAEAILVEIDQRYP